MGQCVSRNCGIQHLWVTEYSVVAITALYNYHGLVQTMYTKDLRVYLSQYYYGMFKIINNLLFVPFNVCIPNISYYTYIY